MNVVTNSELLINAMGCWPSFHDANLVSADLERDACRVSIHVFKVTDQIDDNGYCVLTDHHLAYLEMLGITECTLPSDYDGDIIFDLTVERSGEMITVNFDSAIDPDRMWYSKCREVRVTDVVPCSPKGQPTI